MRLLLGESVALDVANKSRGINDSPRLRHVAAREANTGRSRGRLRLGFNRADVGLLRARGRVD